MCDEIAVIWAMIMGILIGSLFGIMMVLNLDSASPYKADSTRIDLVKQGYAKWITSEDGSVEWELIKKEVKDD